MHSNSTSGAFDDLGDIHTAKGDINQHIAAALLALQCVGLHPVMVHPAWCRGRLDMSSPLSIPFSTFWQWSMWEILMRSFCGDIRQSWMDRCTCWQILLEVSTCSQNPLLSHTYTLSFPSSQTDFKWSSLVLFLSPVLLLLAHLFPLYFVSILSFLVPWLSREQYCAGQRGWGWKAGWGGCRCSVTTALQHHTHEYIAPY